MAESVDCSEFCRLCLVKEQVNTPIFEELGDLQQIYTKITACLPIKVSIEDPLPKRICDDCSYKLDQQYQFWNTSLNAEKQLRQWLGLPDETTTTTTKSESSSGRIKKEKDEPVSKRPRRNARRKAAANIRQAAAVAAASDSGPGEDMDLDFAKVENDSDNDLNDNNESLGDSTYMNVGLDDGESGEAGPSGLQKAVAASNSGSTDPNQQGILPEDNAIKEESKVLQYVYEQANDTLVLEFIDSKADDDIVEDNRPATYIEDDEDIDYEEEDDDDHKAGDITTKRGFCKRCNEVCDVGQVKRLDNGDEHYTCKICLREFNKRYLWYQHYHRTHIGLSKEFECDICNKKFTHNYILENHKQTHNTDNDYQCKFCSKRFKTNANLYQHCSRVHKGKYEEKKYPCDICNRLFTFQSQVRKHKEVHKETKDLQCQHCDKTFKSKINLYVHVKAYHNPKERIRCNECNMEFAYNQQLRHHVDYVHKGVRYECADCKKLFKTIFDLRQHKRWKHDPTFPRPTTKYQCEFCEKSFTWKTGLDRHKKCHMDYNRPICEVCGKSFAMPSELKHHKLIHTGVKPFSCDICKKEFRKRANLRLHMRTHTGEKPYPCSMCPQRFSQCGPRKIHMRLHTGERPYACDLCDKRFISKSLLNSHQRGQHKIIQNTNNM